MNEPTTIRIDLDLGALPAEGVESFIGGAIRVEKDGKKWAGFVTAAELEDDAIHLTVQAVEAEAWPPECEAVIAHGGTAGRQTIR